MTGRRRVGKYELWEEIARGGMGVVYRGYQPTLDRLVAVKALLPELAADEEFKSRFRTEAGAIAMLNHPNIVHIHDILEEDTYYIVMELVSGPALREVLAGAGRLPPGRAADLARQTALGLSAAHAQGIVHRDIKPGNLLLTSGGDLKIMDFGVAKMASSSFKTQAGVRLGTPAYMSPEQARGEPVDARSDLYSLCAMLFELLTGRLPFEGSDPFDVALKHITAPPPDPRGLDPSLPQELASIVLRGMAKVPADRPQHALDLAGWLKPLADAARRRLPPRGRRAPSCPSCRAAIRPDFASCPACGTALYAGCVCCRQAVPVGGACCDFCWATQGPPAPVLEETKPIELPVAPPPPPVSPASPVPPAPAERLARAAGEVREAGRELWQRVRSIDPSPLVDRLRGRSPSPGGPTEPAVPTAPAGAFCSGCGRSVSQDFLRCPWCGAALR